MSLNAPEIARVLAEIVPVCEGAFVNRIRLQHGTELLLDLRNGPARPTLLLSADPRASRIGFIARPSGTGEDPGRFLQLLRARLEGLRIAGIEQVDGDRIVRIAGAGKGDGPRTPVALIAELMGARSNFHLLDDEGHVEGSLHAGAFRPGEIWCPPERSGDAPTSARDFGDQAGKSYSERIGNFYATELKKADEARARDESQAALSRERARLKRLVKNLRGDLARAGDPGELRLMGQLLKANARLVPPEATEVLLPRWDRPDETVRIALKPSESAGANADRYFEQARRAERTIESATTRLDEAGAKLGKIDALLAAVQTTSAEELAQAVGQLGIPATAKQSSRRGNADEGTSGSAAMEKLFRKLGIKPRRFESESGQLILVGRTSTENDTLTTKVARPHDFFFHVVGAPGSHVIACVPKGGQLDPGTRTRAAELALRYSSLSKSGRGEVSCCERRYVRKRKGDPPGLVHLTGRTQTLWVELSE